MMVILSISIATVKNIAARQADIVRYYRIENDLQAAAENGFNEVVANLSKNAKYYDPLDNNTKYLKSKNVVINDHSITVKLYAKKAVNSKKIFIMSLAQLPTYNYDKYPIYKKIVGYMSAKTPNNLNDESTVDQNEDEKYEFTGYIY